jgi:hypothetical protein
MKVEEIVREGFDLHFHIGPDVLPRKYTVEELLAEEEGKLKGIVLKSHSFPTIQLINGIKDAGLKLFGSVTLNWFVGGLNPNAVYASAVMSKLPLFVWLPTLHAENFLAKSESEYEIPPDWSKDPNFVCRKKDEVEGIRVVDQENRLMERVEKVLQAAKRMECILCTGHISWEEAQKVAERVLELEIPAIITHPISKHINMPVEVQKALAEDGVYIEHCFITYHDGLYRIEDFVQQIKAVGARRCILTSDAGQIGNPGSSESLMKFIELLLQHGITKNEIKKMVVKNPRDILGVE